MRYAVSIVLLLAGPAGAQDLRGPALAAASNFGQGMRGEILEAARAMPVRDLRDAVYWDRTDRGDGTFVFDDATTTYPDLLAEAGVGMSLTVNNGHPAYDDGATPHTPPAIAQFGQHAAAMVARFPAIHSIEVGNEFNSANFVRGPVRERGLDGRAEAYFNLLVSVHDAVRATDLDVTILGGGVHSIPVGYLADLFALGAADYMDALALHPYTTAPEQLARQIAVLRAVPGVGDMPIEITEFGETDPAAAPDYFLRDYCQMALSGVTRAVWYPLNVRGDGLAPLLDETVNITDVGRAFLFAAEMFEGEPVENAAPDPFTYACRFGETRLVVWGMPRDVTLAEGVRVVSATGDELPADGQRLNEAVPLVFLADRPITLGADVRLGPHGVLADSFHQFAYPGIGPEDGFQRFLRRDGEELPFDLRPGQEREGTLWTPYLGRNDDGGLRLTADSMLPSGGGASAREIVHRYVAQDSGPLRIESTWAVPERSTDGVSVRVLQNNAVLSETVVTDSAALVLTVSDVAEGDRIDLRVGPRGEAAGDLVSYRITLRRP